MVTKILIVVGLIDIMFLALMWRRGKNRNE